MIDRLDCDNCPPRGGSCYNCISHDHSEALTVELRDIIAELKEAMKILCEITEEGHGESSCGYERGLIERELP